MSFLKDLFARGPALPEPVLDPFGGDDAARAAVAAFSRGDWKPAAAWLAAASSGDDRAFLIGSLAETNEARPVKAWLAAQPDRAEPHVLTGLLTIAAAWAIRGSGRAEDVAEEAWPKFHAGLEEAETHFTAALERAPDDATPWGYLLITARGLNADVDDILGLYAEARARDPQGWLAAFMALDALTEKWSGSHDVMFSFVKELNAQEPDGSPLLALVPLAHVERWAYFSMEDPPDRKAQRGYFARRDVRDDLRAAWQRGPGSPAFQPGRFAATQRNLFAFAFCMGEDMGPAQEAFRQIGGRVTHTPWARIGDPVSEFKRARKDAFGV